MCNADYGKLNVHVNSIKVGLSPKIVSIELFGPEPKVH